MVRQTVMKNRKSKAVPVFVGRYRRTVGEQGRIRFPADWLPLLGDDGELFVLPNPDGTKTLLAVLATDYRKEANPPPATLLKVASDGFMSVPMRLLAHAGITSKVCLLGKIRMVELSAITSAT